MYDVCDINVSVKQKVPTVLKEVIDSITSNGGPPTAVAKICVKYAASMLYVRVRPFHLFTNKMEFVNCQFCLAGSTLMKLGE